VYVENKLDRLDRSFVEAVNGTGMKWMTYDDLGDSIMMKNQPLGVILLGQLKTIRQA